MSSWDDKYYQRKCFPLRAMFSKVVSLDRGTQSKRRHHQRRSSLPAQLSDTTSLRSIGDSKSQSQKSSTSTSTRSVQTNTSFDTNFDDQVSSEFYSKVCDGNNQEENYTSLEQTPTKRYVVHADVNKDASTSRTDRRVFGSTESTPSKSSGILNIRKSPYKKNFTKSRVVYSKSCPTSPKRIKFQEPPKYRKEKSFDSLTPESRTPPSPAPKDPASEALHRTFHFKTTNRFGIDFYEIHPFESEFRSTFGDPDTRLYFEGETPDNPHGYYLPVYDHREDTQYLRPESPEEYYYETRPASPRTFMGRMNPQEDNDRKLIIEFCHLLEKSKQLFNGLRELPQYGHKQWHSYFGRTFDVYTKLWKFQQQHRAILDTKYGLKRWQVGEIASKIGQLYYHFYLRTSETAYLNEAFSFYYAIRNRSYYTKACKEDKCELMVKKLRYYARFIVVCLLLKKFKLVRELIKELDKQILEYGNNYDPDDHIEWTVVVEEVKSFINAEAIVSVIHPDNYPVTLSHRLNVLTAPPAERSVQMTITLHEVLIVGSSSQQVKFSELTMDMYRMIQTLEREPSGDVQQVYDESPRQRFIPPPSATTSKSYLDSAPHRHNPHKYLLFKPSPSQILVYLGSGCDDLPPNGALLLYISADGQIVQPSRQPEDAGYDSGGLITTSKNDFYKDYAKETKSASAKYKELHCLYPGDLYPFTRRPFFVIVESDNSYVFQNIPRMFGQPLVVLMSPLDLPSNYPDRRQQGSLFTLFLHSPLSAFCYCCDIDSISLMHWERGQIYVEKFLIEAYHIMNRSLIDPVYLSFMGDDFLRLLLLRFVFCEVSLRLLKAFRGRSHLTRSTPQIPDDIFDHPSLIRIVMDLANHLKVERYLSDLSASGLQPSKD